MSRAFCGGVRRRAARAPGRQEPAASSRGPEDGEARRRVPVVKGEEHAVARRRRPHAVARRRRPRRRRRAAPLRRRRAVLILLGPFNAAERSFFHAADFFLRLGMVCNDVFKSRESDLNR